MRTQAPVALLALLMAGPAWPALAGVLEDLSGSVVFLQANLADGRRLYGTGVFVMGQQRPYLVTAAHVARTLVPDSSATIRIEGDKPFTLTLSVLTEGTASIPFYYSKAADVAIARITPKTKELGDKLQHHFLPLAWLDSEKQAPSRSLTLTVLGFPLALGIGGSFSPISRETKPASGLITVKFDGENEPVEVFLTQDPSVGGFSGAPVFDTMLSTSGDGGGLTVRAGEPKLVGIAKGTLSDNTGGKMGAVVPSFFVVEAIKADDR